MFCAKCGGENSSEAAFCRGCGEALSQSQQPQSQQAYSAVQSMPADTSLANADAMLSEWFAGVPTPPEDAKYYLWLGIATLAGLVLMTVVPILFIVPVGAVAYSAVCAFKNGNSGRFVLGASAVLTLALVLIFASGRILGMRPVGSAIGGYVTMLMLLTASVLVSSIVGYVMAFRSAKGTVGAR